ncbi:MAG: hypothetical protein WD250_15090, partial [Egibacteraceae bacterium]
MSSTASADLAAPAVCRAVWAARGPVVARERGPRYAAGNPADGDVGGGGDEGLGALLGSADVGVVAGALAGLPTDRLARVLAATVGQLDGADAGRVADGAVGRLDGEDAAAVVAAAARPLAEDAAGQVCRSLVSGWDDA